MYCASVNNRQLTKNECNFVRNGNWDLCNVKVVAYFYLREVTIQHVPSEAEIHLKIHTCKTATLNVNYCAFTTVFLQDIVVSLPSVR